MSRLTLQVHPRTVIGKQVKNLRKQGRLPANVYGHNVPSQALEFDATTFNQLHRHLSASSIINMDLDGAVRPVMVHRIQRDFRTGRPTHVELFAVNMLEKLTASVPIVVSGVSEAVRKNESLVVLQELDSLEVTCLPDDLPEKIEASAASLVEAGDSILVRDLVVDRTKIEIRANDDDRVVSLTTSKYRPEETEAVTAAEGEPATGESAEGSAS